MSAPIPDPPLGGVLVGGRSTRFGSDKAAAHVGGRSMVARAVDTLRGVADPVVLLGGDGTLGRRLALPWRADDRPGRGPLSGLASGLRWAHELGRGGLVVLACDLPLVTREVMESVVAAVGPDVDAVVATDERDGVQPLCGWYATRVLGAVEDALARGRHSARALLDDLRAEHVRLSDMSGRDHRTALLNVNTPEDLVEATRHASAGRPR